MAATNPAFRRISFCDYVDPEYVPLGEKYHHHIETYDAPPDYTKPWARELDLAAFQEVPAVNRAPCLLIEHHLCKAVPAYHVEPLRSVINSITHFPVVMLIESTELAYDRLHNLVQSELPSVNQWFGLRSTCVAAELREWHRVIKSTAMSHVWAWLQPSESTIALRAMLRPDVIYSAHASRRGDRIEFVMLGNPPCCRNTKLNPRGVRTIINQCMVLEVPVFFCGWGRYLPLNQLPGAARNAEGYIDLDDSAYREHLTKLSNLEQQIDGVAYRKLAWYSAPVRSS